MPLLNAALLCSIGITLILGLLVFLTNSRRLINKQFLVLSIHMAIWTFSVLQVILSQDAQRAAFWIRSASFVTAFFPGSFSLLFAAIKFHDHSWISIYRKLFAFLVFNLGAAVLCLSPFFMHHVVIPEDAMSGFATVPEAVYGPGYVIYVVYFIATCIAAGIFAFRDFRTSSGLQRYEFQFILLGFAASFIVGVVSTLVLPLIVGNSQTSQFGPISVIAVNIAIAYGIATRRILEVGAVLRKIVAYTLFIIFLVLMYVGLQTGIEYLLSAISVKDHIYSEIMAMIIVAFSLIPAQGRLQDLTNKLIATHAMDVPATMKKAGKIFQSITTIDALLSHFSTLLMDAVGTEHVVIMSTDNGTFTQQYPPSYDETRIQISKTSPIIEMIHSSKEPVCRDSLTRIRKTPLIAAAESQLKEVAINVAVGIFSAAGLSGLVLFGSRRGGRIYDRTEQDALQILANQLAVALDNANLYTQMQDSKIRNDILLDQLVGGVIAVNTDRKITLINREAQRITGLGADQVMGLDIDVLPKPISKAFEKTLADQYELRNSDASLPAGEGDHISIRMGTVYLIGHDKKPMGALLVFTDLTEIKTLEEQIRRTDQLASVGTLAAGMAHEIKNPLVTIKTFTQLLPRRFGDADFRETFSSLVEHEVTRIDRIVNQLLSFSKPAKPSLNPMHLHETIEHTLKLIHEQLRQKDIALHKKCLAGTDLISGDADLLTQALINLHLNAIDAMGRGGTLTVNTSNGSYNFAKAHHSAKVLPLPCIKVQIIDTGSGIPPDKVSRIFDPFFTSKSEGTGMGLSVSHGIFQEHHGAVEVESAEGEGTIFRIYLPLLTEESDI
ncbi:MAG: PAS domain-containing protein [Kiritimatiellales bacterium]|nr:PAS domain-containing protein [Kiritimatiellales bacterium]